MCKEIDEEKQLEKAKVDVVIKERVDAEEESERGASEFRKEKRQIHKEKKK